MGMPDGACSAARVETRSLWLITANRRPSAREMYEQSLSDVWQGLPLTSSRVSRHHSQSQRPTSIVLLIALI
jgi:hypothetical protein